MNIQKCWILAILPVLLLSSCGAPQIHPVSLPVPTAGATLSPEQQETTTLLSLQKVDDYPLYTMRYFGSTDRRAWSDPPAGRSGMSELPAQAGCGSVWGCSLFAALGDEENRLFGRNFDWRFSPALLLFTDPPGGYASVSIVDMEYLGFSEEQSKTLTDLPLEQRRPLLNTPALPFDGMNEQGLVVGMSAVDAQKMPYDPQKQTIGQLKVIREMLDHAATVDEAIAIMDQYNIDMSDVPIHYLIASAAGESAVVEFYQGERRVFRNENPWQVSTNFLLSPTFPSLRGQCWRYDLIDRRLSELGGRISAREAMELLQRSSQDTTQWSVVYRMTGGEVEIVMGRDYTGEVHKFVLEGEGVIGD